MRDRRLVILFTVLQYIWTSRLHCRYNENGNYALFRYEDLLADPEKTLGALCDFVEIDYVPQMLTPQGGSHQVLLGKEPQASTRKRPIDGKRLLPLWRKG